MAVAAQRPRPLARLGALAVGLLLLLSAQGAAARLLWDQPGSGTAPRRLLGQAEHTYKPGDKARRGHM